MLYRLHQQQAPSPMLGDEHLPTDKNLNTYQSVSSAIVNNRTTIQSLKGNSPNMGKLNRVPVP